MKKSAFLLLLMGFGIIGHAQCIIKSQGFYKYCVQEEDTVFSKVHLSSIPQFDGDFAQWFSDHVEYPYQALDSEIQGTVYLTFTVETDGAISTVKVLRGINKYLDNESVRLLSSMPKWKPGVSNHRKIKTVIGIAIHFRITDRSYPPPKSIHVEVVDSADVHQH